MWHWMAVHCPNLINIINLQIICWMKGHCRRQSLAVTAQHSIDDHGEVLYEKYIVHGNNQKRPKRQGQKAKFNDRIHESRLQITRSDDWVHSNWHRKATYRNERAMCCRWNLLKVHKYTAKKGAARRQPAVDSSRHENRRNTRGNPSVQVITNMPGSHFHEAEEETQSGCSEVLTLTYFRTIHQRSWGTTWEDWSDWMKKLSGRHAIGSRTKHVSNEQTGTSTAGLAIGPG